MTTKQDLFDQFLDALRLSLPAYAVTMQLEVYPGHAGYWVTSKEDNTQVYAKAWPIERLQGCDLNALAENAAMRLQERIKGANVAS